MEHEMGVVPKTDIEPVDDVKIDSLKHGDMETTFEALGMAAAASADARRRYVLVCDATGSMDAVWSMAKTALKHSVDQIKLKTLVPLQIKVVAYRDITCDTDFIESSEWSDDTPYLKNFIENISCHGGDDYPESVDVGLMESLLDTPNQIILIGDAPSRFESPAYKEAEAAGQIDCPIFALYTNNEPSLVKNFERIAKLSGGKAMHLQSLEIMEDIISTLLSTDKKLMIEYQPKSIEGRKLLLEIQGDQK